MNTTKTKDLSQFNQDHLRDKLYSKIERSSKDQCLNWTGARNGYGYGIIWIGKHSLLAHRISFHLHNGPIPDGMFVSHTCDNPSCINPNHLKQVQQPKAKKGRPVILSSDAALNIRKRWSQRPTMTKLAKEYGVSTPTIRDALYGGSWKHLPSLHSLNAQSNQDWPVRGSETNSDS